MSSLTGETLGGSPPPKYNSTAYKDPPSEYLEKVKDGICTAAAKWNIELDPQMDYVQYSYNGSQSTRFGNRSIEPGTKESYEGCLRQLWRFCIYKGDYESMLILSSPAPPYCVSVKVETVEEFLRFKRKPKGTALGVADILNRPMYCDGAWKAPKREWIFSAAITDLHKHHNHVAEYVEACPDCLKLGAELRHRGCLLHSGSPLIRRKGNPTTHEIYTNTTKQLWKDDHAYKENGSAQFLVEDVRKLLRRFLAAPCLANLQMSCIMLVAILMFLRHDEFHKIHSDEFIENEFHILSNSIEELVLKVKGKVDEEEVGLRLSADHEFPDLCPIRHLMVYMYLLSWKGGYLFPTQEEMENPPEDGIYKTTADYDGIMVHLIQVCGEVLGEQEGFKVGTHSFRKTGCLFAIFGQCNRDDLKPSMRHSKKSKDTSTYVSDADALYQKHKRDPHPHNNVRKWKCIRVESHRNNARMSNVSGHIHKPLAKLPTFFVETLLGCRPDHTLTRDAGHLIKTAHNWGPIAMSGSTELEVFSERNRLGPEQVQELYRIVHTMTFQQVEAQRQVLMQAQAAAQAPPATAGTPTSEDLPYKRPRVASNEGGSNSKNDLPNRLGLRNMATAREKIDVMARIWEEKDNWGSLTSGASSFVKKYLRPAMNCLHDHFGGDKERFCEKWPDFNHATFPTTCCAGKGTACAPKAK